MLLLSSKPVAVCFVCWALVLGPLLAAPGNPLLPGKWDSFNFGWRGTEAERGQVTPVTHSPVASLPGLPIGNLMRNAISRRACIPEKGS